MKFKIILTIAKTFKLNFVIHFILTFQVNLTIFKIKSVQISGQHFVLNVSCRECISKFSIKVFFSSFPLKSFANKNLKETTDGNQGERDKEEIILEKFSKNKLILFTPLSYFTYLCLLTTSKCHFAAAVEDKKQFNVWLSLFAVFQCECIE